MTSHRKWRIRLALIVMLLALAAWLLPKALPQRLIAQRLSAAVERATGRKLEIGALSIWLLPTPGFSADRITLANPGWAGPGPIVSIRRIEVWPAILPLLWGRVVIDELDLFEPSVDLRVGADGRENWVMHRMAQAPLAMPPLPREIASGPRMPLILISFASSELAESANHSWVSLPPAWAQILERLRRFGLRTFYMTEGRLLFRNKKGAAYSLDNMWAMATGGDLRAVVNTSYGQRRSGKVRGIQPT